MVKIEDLFADEKITRISVLEKDRYINFFEHSHLDNLDHCRFVLDKFPRWSIISGYYAMHDITKLLFAKQFRLKVELDVHSTTIKVLRALVKKKDILELMEAGRKEFISLANDLAGAKNERVGVQYYTGTDYMKEEYRKRAKKFLKNVAEPYLEKIRKLLEEKNGQPSI